MLFKITFCSYLFIGTSNFGAEAENVLKMFLNYMAYTKCISVNQCRRDQKAYQSALPAEIWYQELLIMTKRDVNVIQNMP